MYFRRVTQDSKLNERNQLEEQLAKPSSWMIRARNIVFGETRPDTYTKLTFFLALAIWSIFFLWSIMGNVAIRASAWIEQEKKIPVTQLIEERGLALGFKPNQFLGRLEAFHAVSIGLWLVVFIGLVLLWRKNVKFIYFFFGGTAVYLLFMWSTVGMSYWWNDTTTFDKITFFVFNLQTAIYSYFLKREIKGERSNFFGINEDEEVS